MKTSEWIALVTLVLAAVRMLFDIWFKWKFGRRPSLHRVQLLRFKIRNDTALERRVADPIEPEI